MKKFTFIFVALVLSSLSFSQSEIHQTVFEQFKNDYNSNSFDAIFESFSADMQNALPLEKTNQFFSGLQQQEGKITASDFQNMGDENTAFFKTTFERSIFEIQISIDAAHKISGFLVKPFVSHSTSTLVNDLSDYPKQIAAVIYENAKNFPPNTQLAIAVINNGKVNFYGVQIINDALVPIKNQDKVFEIGSLTKVFTATVLAELVVDGKVKLKDKINPLYPFLFKNKIELTFENLANHTSGLPRLPTNLDISDDVNPYKNYGAKELDFYLANQMILAKAENNAYDYSNLGAGLLGHTLGLSQKVPFEKLLELVFEKYKMTHSFTSPKDVGGQLVSGLNAEGGEVSNWDFDVLLGGGGILSSASDLVLFANAQFQLENKGPLLTRTPTATVNENMKIGLGWHLLKSRKGRDLVWHNGGTGGYSSSMVLDIKNKNAVIVLSNVSGLSPENKKIDEIGFGLFKLMDE
jgi:CubicO group peptidase (beta-lactamase class C family)